jgi:hypothetical protein
MTTEKKSELGSNDIDGGDSRDDGLEGRHRRQPTEVRSHGTVACGYCSSFFLANHSSDTELKSELILIQSLKNLLYRCTTEYKRKKYNRKKNQSKIPN